MIPIKTDSNKTLSLHDTKIKYKDIHDLKLEHEWSQLSNILLNDILEKWFQTLTFHTSINYRSAFYQLAKKNLIQLDMNLQLFTQVRYESIVDQIKQIEEWSEATKQARAAAFIAFTSFLQRQSNLFKKALPNKDKGNTTFYKIRDKVDSTALSETEVKSFLKALTKISSRDTLLAKLILQGGRRKSEVLELEIPDILWDRQQIQYKISKSKTIQYAYVTYPIDIFEELKKNIENRTSGLVFLHNGKKIYSDLLNRSFLKAGNLAHIPFRITPHCLRATFVTRLKSMGIQDSEIQKITKQSLTTLLSYDKTDQAENISSKIQMF